MESEVKVGEVYYLPVRVTSCNDNMAARYYAVEVPGMETLVVSSDGKRLLYVSTAQLVEMGESAEEAAGQVF